MSNSKIARNSARREMARLSRKQQRPVKRYSAALKPVTTKIKAALKLVRAAKAVTKKARKAAALTLSKRKLIVAANKAVAVVVSNPILRAATPVNLALVRPTRKPMLVGTPAKCPSYATAGAFGSRMSKALGMVASSTFAHEGDWAAQQFLEEIPWIDDQDSNTVGAEVTLLTNSITSGSKPASVIAAVAIAAPDLSSAVEPLTTELAVNSAAAIAQLVVPVQQQIEVPAMTNLLNIPTLEAILAPVAATVQRSVIGGTIPEGTKFPKDFAELLHEEIAPKALVGLGSFAAMANFSQSKPALDPVNQVFARCFLRLIGFLRSNNPLNLPECVNLYAPGIVPTIYCGGFNGGKTAIEGFPGATMINDQVSRVILNGKSAFLVANLDDSGKSHSGEIEYVLPAGMDGLKINAIQEILTKHEVQIAGQPPKIVGFTTRQAFEYAPHIKALMHYCNAEVAGTPVNVYYPEWVKPALEVYLVYATPGQPITVSCNYVAVPNWVQPVHGLSYETVRSAFRYMQTNQVFNLPVASKTSSGSAFVYEDTEVGFDFWLANGSRFVVFAPQGATGAMVYFQKAKSPSFLRIRSAIVGSEIGFAEYGVDEAVIMQPLDVLAHIMESFGFAALNRKFFNNRNVSKEASQSATEIERYIQGFIPTENEETLPVGGVRSQRQILEDNVPTTAKLCVRLNLEIVPNYDKGIQYGLRAYGESQATSFAPKGITRFYANLKAAASLVNEVNAVALISFANAKGFAIQPMKDVSDFMDHSLCAVRYNSLEVTNAKALIIEMFAHNWEAWELEDLGDLSFATAAETTSLICAALLRNKSFAAILGISGLDAKTVNDKADFFWTLVQENLVISHSNKEAKLFKRCISTYSTVCAVLDEQVVGWNNYNYLGAQESRALLVSAAIMVTSPTQDPGMASATPGFITAVYPSRHTAVSFLLPTDPTVEFVLDAGLVGLATEITTMEAGLVGYSFAQRLEVKAGTILGVAMLNGEAYENVTVAKDGYLKSIQWQFTCQAKVDYYWSCYVAVEVEVTDSLKLREGLKANLMSVDLTKTIGYEGLNGADFGTSVNLVIPADSYKGADNFVFHRMRLVGIQYSARAEVNAEMRALLIATNNTVQQMKGNAVTDLTSCLIVCDDAYVAGAYAAMEADFERRFGRAIWEKQFSPNSALAEMWASQSRAKAIADAVKIASYNEAVEMGEISAEEVPELSNWRLVDADEASTIRGEEGSALPNSLIDALLKAERNGTYYDLEAPITQAFIVTNTDGEIGENDHLVCVWQERIENKTYFMMLQRGWGYARKDGMDFLYPVQVEYATIEQCVSKTSLMSFAMVQNSIDGNKELAFSQTEQSKKNLALNVLLTKFNTWNSDSVLSVKGQFCGTVDLTGNIRAGAVAGTLTYPEQVFTTEELERLRDPKCYLNKKLFMESITYFVGNNLLLIQDAEHKVVALHMGTLMAWGGGSLNTNTGDSAMNSLCDWFKHWIIRGALPKSTECTSAALAFSRTLSSYLRGRNHIKSLLRGESTVYMKVAASAIVPNDEVWVVGKDAKHFSKVFGARVESIKHVGFRRMPMKRSNVSKIRFLSQKDVNAIYREYGVLFSTGRVYMGAGQMYANFGDLDGDACEFDNLSNAVKRGLIKVDNFGSIKALLIEVLGVDMFSYKFHLSGKPAQYVADHFAIKSKAQFDKKSLVSFSKSVMTLDKFAAFQKSAATVQTITVGLTYASSTICSMLAEIIPVVNAEIKACGDSLWLNAFRWALNPDMARSIGAKLEQIYEIALGGYDADMANVTLGYLVRAMNGETEVNDWSMLEEVKADIDTRVTSGITTVIPGATKLVSFNHVPVAKVKASLEALGFEAKDLDIFRDVFLVAGQARRLGRPTNEMKAMIPASLRLILNICQTVLDVTQNKLNSSEGESTSLGAYFNFMAEITEKAADTEAGEGSLSAKAVLALNQAILTKTVVGVLFNNYITSYLVKKENILEVDSLEEIAEIFELPLSKEEKAELKALEAAEEMAAMLAVEEQLETLGF